MILVKYGELTTKKGNRKLFINTLTRNIIDKLEGIEYKIIKNHVRMFIETIEEDKVLNILKNIFGIHAVCKTIECSSDFESIKTLSLEIMSNLNFKTFKVDTSRADKKFPIPSMEVSKEIGAHILKNIKDISVDVNSPDILLKIEIRNNSTYIYTNQLKGIGGYPVGVQGNGMLMLSGGIDSPVAGYLAMKRGVALNCVYFESLPHTSLKAREKVITLTKELSKYSKTIKLHIVPFTELQEAIYKNIDNTYMITIMRRMMYRISERMALKNKCHVLINGENIGQVASQTLTSMKTINIVTFLPVIRPVSCFDKLEIIDIAKKINTYETSILPYEDCCTVFVPKHPVINPNTNTAEEYEELIDYKKMIETCINNTQTIKINQNYKIINNDLL